MESPNAWGAEAGEQPAVSRVASTAAATPARKAIRTRARRRRRYQRKVRLVAILSALLVLAVVGAGAALGAREVINVEGQISAELNAGQAQLVAGKADLKQLASAHDTNAGHSASGAFTAAREHFAAARREAERDPLLSRAIRTPVADKVALPRLRAVQGISAMGIAIADAGIAALQVDLTIASEAPAGGPAGSGITHLLDAMKQSEPSLAAMRADFERARSAAAQVDPSVLTGHQAQILKEAVASIDSGIQAVDETGRLIPVVLDIFGVNGPRTYLVEQLDPAELRPGGGLLGTVTVVHADQGMLDVLQSVDVYTLISSSRPVKGKPGYVAPPQALQGLLGNGSWSLLDSNFYPDFPANAQQSLTFAESLLKTHFDGAIAMDYYTVQEILRMTGPIQVPGSTLTLSADNLITQLLQGEISGGDIYRSKKLVAGIAKPMLDRVSALPGGSWLPLLQTLNLLVSGRHLEAWFRSDGDEQEMTRIGWSGETNPTRMGDFMLEVEANTAATKANYFLTRTFDVTLERSGNTLHHTVAINLANAEPAGYPNVYYCYLRFYVAADATNLKIAGTQPAGYSDLKPPEGLMVIDGWLSLTGLKLGKPGTGTATITYDTPWRPDASGVDRIYWEKQGGTLKDTVNVVWVDGGTHYKASGDLSQDRTIELGPTGVTLATGQPGTAHLPSLSF